jgi:hypothetical protein
MISEDNMNEFTSGTLFGLTIALLAGLKFAASPDRVTRLHRLLMAWHGETTAEDKSAAIGFPDHRLEEVTAMLQGLGVKRGAKQIAQRVLAAHPGADDKVIVAAAVKEARA